MHRALFGILMIVGFAVGCTGVISSEPKVDVETLAKTWPPYQPPNRQQTAPLIAAIEQRSETSREPFAAKRSRVAPPIQPRSEWDLRTTVIDSLGRIGGAAVTTLIQELKSQDPERRVQAAKMLARIGPDANTSVPALIELLKEDNVPVQKAAAHALGQIGPAAQAAIEPLMEAIRE